jgi:hypothetical protein
MATAETFVMPFGKHKDKPLSAIPAGYLMWLLDNADSLRADTRAVIEAFVGRAPTPDPGHHDRAPGEPPPPARQRAAAAATPIARCVQCGLGGSADRPLVHADCVVDQVPF